MRSDRPEQLPRARTDQLIVKEVDDEVLVYDLTNDKAHCLNDTAATVWKNCDGKNSVADISTSLANDTGVAVDEGVVWLALDQLKQFKLLADVPSAPAVFTGMSRRHLMRNLGLAAIALPSVVAMVVPTPSQAQSCIAKTGNCSPPGSPGGCCAGCSCNGSGKCAGSC